MMWEYSGNPERERRFWDRLRGEAAETAVHLRQTAGNPASRVAEHVALWHTAELTVDCVNAVDPQYHVLSTIGSPPVGSPDLRYEVEAGIRMVPGLGPWGPLEIGTLRKTALPVTEGDCEAWATDMARQNVLFLENWAAFLSGRDSEIRRAGAQDYGRVSVLAVAAERLAVGVQAILESVE